MVTTSVNVPTDTDHWRQQYEELAALAGALVHEIRNPLSTMSLNLELVAEDLAEGETQRDRRLLGKVRMLHRECHNLERMLNDFLQFARAGTFKPVRVEMNDVLRKFIDYFTPQAREHGVEISPHLVDPLPAVAIDPVLWQQVLLNLAANAMHAMPEGGTLEIQSRLSDGQVVVELIDNGAGMDEKTRDRIFEAFFSTRSGGSGLGLPTVRRIVHAHHGTIECDSEPGRGTRFRIGLPVLE